MRSSRDFEGLLSMPTTSCWHFRVALLDSVLRYPPVGKPRAMTLEDTTEASEARTVRGQTLNPKP